MSRSRRVGRGDTLLQLFSGVLASKTVLGLLVGLTLGVVGAFGGFGAFLLVLVLGVVGLLVGRLLDGELDLDALSGRGRSSGSRR